MKTKHYTPPPPDPIYRAGKRKERVTKVINILKGLLAEELEGDRDIENALTKLKGYRNALDEI